LKAVVDNLLVLRWRWLKSTTMITTKFQRLLYRQGHIKVRAALALATDTSKQGSTGGAHRRRGLDMVDFLAQHDGTLYMFLRPVNGSSNSDSDFKRTWLDALRPDVTRIPSMPARVVSTPAHVVLS